MKLRDICVKRTLRLITLMLRLWMTDDHLEQDLEITMGSEKPITTPKDRSGKGRNQSSFLTLERIHLDSRGTSAVGGPLRENPQIERGLQNFAYSTS